MSDEPKQDLTVAGLLGRLLRLADDPSPRVQAAILKGLGCDGIGKNFPGVSECDTQDEDVRKTGHGEADVRKTGHESATFRGSSDTDYPQMGKRVADCNTDVAKRNTMKGIPPPPNVLFLVEQEEYRCANLASLGQSSPNSTQSRTAGQPSTTGPLSHKPVTPTSTAASTASPSSWKSKLQALLNLDSSSTEPSNDGPKQEPSQPSCALWMKRLQQLFEAVPHLSPAGVKLLDSGDIFVSFQWIVGGWKKQRALTAPYRVTERMTADEFSDEVTRTRLPPPRAPD